MFKGHKTSSLKYAAFNSEVYYQWYWLQIHCYANKLIPAVLIITLVPVQNFYRDLAKIGEISPRSERSRRDWWDLAEISPWFLLDSKSRRDPGEICSISPRLPRTRRDCRDLAEIVEILPWRSWNSKSRRDRGEISSISPSLPRSRRDL